MSKLKRRRRRAKSNPSPAPRRNPASSTLADVGTGFGAFAASRLLTRMATMATSSRKPSWARHAGAAAALATFFAAYFGAGRVKALQRFQTPILLGAGVAALQTVVQTYLTSLSWLVSEVPARELAGAQAAQGFGDAGVLPADPNWYTTNDAFDGGRWREVLPGELETAAPLPRRTSAPPTPAAAAQVDDLMADLEADAMKSWSFGGGASGYDA